MTNKEMISHERLLLKHMLQKLGVWNEYLKERKKSFGCDGEFERGVDAQLRSWNKQCGCIIGGFDLTSISFLWHPTDKGLVFWCKINQKMSIDPKIKQIHKQKYE